MTVIFDGKEFAKEKEEALQGRVEILQKKGITPKMVSIVVGDVDGSMKYQEMKKRAGERVGVELEIIQFQEGIEVSKVIEVIKKENEDPNVHGVMVQLPLPKHFSQEEKEFLINTIDLQKDVDGMRDDSPFTTPVVKAVLEAIDEGLRVTGHALNSPQKTAIVGAKGFEGKKMVKAIMGNNHLVVRLDKEELEAEDKDDSRARQTSLSDIVVSCTGVPNVIRADMIREGTLCIDVGTPKGDFDFESVSQKAGFITPVPGGIGPVTIVSLMENIVEAAEKRLEA